MYTVNTLDIDVSQVMPIENEEKEQSQMLPKMFNLPEG